MTDKFNIVLLAAGKGTRLKLDVPKPLCPFLGSTLMDYVLTEVMSFCQKLNIEPCIDLIVGHQKELIQQHVKEHYSQINFEFIHQEEQLGTGHALQVYFEKKSQVMDAPYTFIMCADTPLLKSHIFSDLQDRLSSTESDGVAATFAAKDPTGYGRIQYLGEGFQIVEQKDADEVQQKITEVNSGLYLVKTSHIKEHINNINSENNSGEFYLTDLFKPEFKVTTMHSQTSSLFEGVNSLRDLERVQRMAIMDKVRQLQEAGVRFINSDSVYIEEDVEVGAGTVIYPNVYLHKGTRIGCNCTIEPNCIFKNSSLANRVTVLAGSYLEDSQVASGTQLGPYARLRPGTDLGENCKIGNFVEVKKAKLDSGVKVSHLSYVGDAEIGENTNIGCGFVTCNYDGKNKHLTRIGKNSFVGSDCQTIAPVNLGDKVYIGSGSTINQDVPDGAFAIARQRQVIKPDMARKFLKKDS